MTEFDDAIALTDTGVEGVCSAEFLDTWMIAEAVNGGLLLAVLGHAMQRRVSGAGGAGRPWEPLSVSGYYLSPGTPGPATVTTEVLRVGRTLATLGASLAQEVDGRKLERLRTLATYGDLTGTDADVRTLATPPALPPREKCVSASDAPPAFLRHSSMLDRVDLRIDPATAGWAIGKPSGSGEIRGWFRLTDGREPDPLALLLAVDAFPPVAFDLGLNGWAPTLELTAHVRARPAPGWLAVRVSTQNLAGGYLEEDAEVWDEAGRLVAQSRQLARAATPAQATHPG